MYLELFVYAVTDFRPIQMYATVLNSNSSKRATLKYDINASYEFAKFLKRESEQVHALYCIMSTLEGECLLISDKIRILW